MQGYSDEMNIFEIQNYNFLDEFSKVGGFLFLVLSFFSIIATIILKYK